MTAEELRREYASVLAELPSVEFLDEALWVEEGLLRIALAHQKRCARCGARQVHDVEEAGQKRLYVADCAIGSGGWYVALSEREVKGYEDPKTGQWVAPYNPRPRECRYWPRFAAHNCPGPQVRRERVLRLMRVAEKVLA